MRRSTLLLTASLAVLALPALAQQPPPPPAAPPAGEPMAGEATAPAGDPMADNAALIANIGKVEANIAEAHARLYTHMLLPADDPDRATYAADYSEDVASVDGYLAMLDGMELPPEVDAELSSFRAEWEEVKTLSTALEAFDAGNLAPPDQIKAHAEAVKALDDYVDAALVAAGVPEDDDVGEAGEAPSSKGAAAAAPGGAPPPPAAGQAPPPPPPGGALPPPPEGAAPPPAPAGGAAPPPPPAPPAAGAPAPAN